MISFEITLNNRQGTKLQNKIINFAKVIHQIKHSKLI